MTSVLNPYRVPDLFTSVFTELDNSAYSLFIFAVTRLIEHDKVNAVIGTYGSSLAMAGGEVAEKAGIPVIGTSCTNPLVTLGKKFYFRACFIDPFQGPAPYSG